MTQLDRNKLIDVIDDTLCQFMHAGTRKQAEAVINAVLAELLDTDKTIAELPPLVRNKSDVQNAIRANCYQQLLNMRENDAK